MDYVERSLPEGVPGAANLYPAARRLSPRSARCIVAWRKAWRLLPGLLLDANGTLIRWWRDESSLDCCDSHFRTRGKSDAPWLADIAHIWIRPRRQWRLAPAANGSVIPYVDPGWTTLGFVVACHRSMEHLLGVIAVFEVVYVGVGRLP